MDNCAPTKIKGRTLDILTIWKFCWFPDVVSSGLRFLEMILIKILSCRVRVVFLVLSTTYGHIQSFFYVCNIRMQKSSWKCQNCVKLKWDNPLVHCDVTCLFTAEKWNFSTQPFLDVCQSSQIESTIKVMTCYIMSITIERNIKDRTNV